MKVGADPESRQAPAGKLTRHPHSAAGTRPAFTRGKVPSFLAPSLVAALRKWPLRTGISPKGEHRWIESPRPASRPGVTV